MKEVAKEIGTFLKVSFLELRVGGLFTTLISFVIPLGVMAMVYFMGALQYQQFGNQLLAGNITVIVSQTCIVTLGTILLQLRLQGGFEFYSTFPIRRFSLIAAIITFRILLIIPYITILMLVSVQWFGVKIQVSPLIVPVLLMVAINFAAIGALLGISFTNIQKSYAVLNIVMFVVMFGTPLYYSVSALPLPLQIFQFGLPFIYAVDSVKRLIYFTGFSERLILDLIALALFTVLSVTIASFFYKWKAIE